MADYPSYPQLVATQPERNSGVQLDVMESGVVRGSSPYDKPLVRFRVQHFLTSADYDALISFAQANAGLFVQFTYAGDSQAVTYNLIIQNINERWTPSGKYFVEVDMMGNPQ